MRHAGERERRTSYSDVLRSHRAGTARSTGGHCGDARGPIGGQTTLYASEGSSGECAILSARVGTQPVRFNIADALDPDGDIPAESEPVAAYLTYLADVTGGAVGNMGFTAGRLRIVAYFRTEKAAIRCGCGQCQTQSLCSHLSLTTISVPGISPRLVKRCLIFLALSSEITPRIRTTSPVQIAPLPFSSKSILLRNSAREPVVSSTVSYWRWHSSDIFLCSAIQSSRLLSVGLCCQGWSGSHCSPGRFLHRSPSLRTENSQPDK